LAFPSHIDKLLILPAFKPAVKIVSFDADGTLIDRCFADIFWEEEVPKLYAKKYSLSFNEAWKIVKRCYDEVGDEDIRWYIADYWFKRFNLDEKPKEILKKLKNKVKIFSDALEAIESLYGKHKLIVVSNASKEFLEIELEKIRDYFSKIYSCTSDFGKVRKDPAVYLRVCKEIGVKPEQVVHVGDHYKFDYEIPRSIGIRAFLIDRAEQHNEALRDLRELLEKI
jgi:putative hydrolase of the HAD superfamily